MNTIKRSNSDICDNIKENDWSIKEFDWSVIHIDWNIESETIERIYNEWINPTESNDLTTKKKPND